PYGLQIKLNQEGIFNLDSEHSVPPQAYEPLTITDYNYCDGKFEVEAVSKSGWGVGYIEQTEYDILLYPIDYLTKPIHHEGREFIPIVELAKIFCPYGIIEITDYECYEDEEEIVCNLVKKGAV